MSDMSDNETAPAPPKPVRSISRHWDPISRREAMAGLLAVFGAMLVVMLAAVIFAPAADPAVLAQVEAQKRQWLADQAKQEAAAERERQRTAALCTMRAACRRYPAAVQDCATAAHIERCIEIKIGMSRIEGLCTNEGEMAYEPDDMPLWGECHLPSWMTR